MKKYVWARVPPLRPNFKKKEGMLVKNYTEELLDKMNDELNEEEIIDLILSFIKVFHNEQPELRFFQIIDLITGSEDTYYWNDRKTLEKIREYLLTH